MGWADILRSKNTDPVTQTDEEQDKNSHIKNQSSSEAAGALRAESQPVRNFSTTCSSDF